MERHQGQKVISDVRIAIIIVLGIKYVVITLDMTTLNVYPRKISHFINANAGYSGVPNS